MCSILGVKSANYYKWLKRDTGSGKAFYDELMGYIIKYDEKYSNTLGYRQMRDRINRDEGKAYSDSMVHKVMKYLGIRSRVRRQRNSCTINAKNARRAKNILGRDFSASRPNEKWVTDVIEFKYYIGARVMKIFLSAIIDLYDRSVIAFVLSDRNDNRLVFETFRKAVSNNPDAHPLFHSDAVFQYTSPAFVHMLEEQGMVQSMSRIGCCIDNGVCEAFWSFIKTEAFEGYRFTSKEELCKALVSWIYYYNNERYQRRFGVRTPNEVRTEALASEVPAVYPIPENKRIEKYKQDHYHS